MGIYLSSLEARPPYSQVRPWYLTDLKSGSDLTGRFDLLVTDNGRFIGKALDILALNLPEEQSPRQLPKEVWPY